LHISGKHSGKYARIEIDFIHSKHLNTPKLRREIWRLFKQEVVSNSETWQKILNLKMRPKKLYKQILKEIKEFEIGIRDEIVPIIGFGNMPFSFGISKTSLISLPAETELIEKFALKIKELIDRCSLK